MCIPLQSDFSGFPSPDSNWAYVKLVTKHVTLLYFLLTVVDFSSLSFFCIVLLRDHLRTVSGKVTRQQP